MLQAGVDLERIPLEMILLSSQRADSVVLMLSGRCCQVGVAVEWVLLFVGGLLMSISGCCCSDVLNEFRLSHRFSMRSSIDA